MNTLGKAALVSSIALWAGACGNPSDKENTTTSSSSSVSAPVSQNSSSSSLAPPNVQASFAFMKPVVIYSEPFEAWGECTGYYASGSINEPTVSFASSSSSLVQFSNGTPSLASSSVSFSSSAPPPPALVSGGFGGGGFAGVSADVAILPTPDPVPDIAADATEFYFSYDESESTASRDLSLDAIFSGDYPSEDWGRPYEFLNAEHFGHFNAQTVGPFAVSMGLHTSNNGAIPVGPQYEGDLHTFGISLSGPELSKEDRRNVVLTLLVDVSGSMDVSYGGYRYVAPQSLLDVAQHAMFKLLPSLKEGDVVNLVTFDTSAETVLVGWQYEDGNCGLVDAVSGLYTRGSTNLNQGIEYAYQAAQETYDPDKANRVIILTDAYANTGEINPQTIADLTVINGLEGIHFSGIGIGDSFNDRFLNELTDIGKGTYSAMITPNDAERIMSSNFTRFVDYAVENVRFKLNYPQSLDQLESAAEDISTEASEVSKVNFSYNSDQFFLESFKGTVAAEDQVTFTVYYDDANGEAQEASLDFSVSEISGQGQDALMSAVMVAKLAQLIGGEISCSELINSDFYLSNIETDIFETYISAAENYCASGPDLPVITPF